MTLVWKMVKQSAGAAGLLLLVLLAPSVALSAGSAPSEAGISASALNVVTGDVEECGLHVSRQDWREQTGQNRYPSEGWCGAIVLAAGFSRPRLGWIKERNKLCHAIRTVLQQALKDGDVSTFADAIHFTVTGIPKGLTDEGAWTFLEFAGFEELKPFFGGKDGVKRVYVDLEFSDSLVVLTVRCGTSSDKKEAESFSKDIRLTSEFLATLNLKDLVGACEEETE